MIKRIIDFIKYDVWRISSRELTGTKSILIRQLQIFLLAVRGFNEDKVQMQASALTFYSLLSLVPVVAMGFGISKGFGMESYLERQLMELFQGREEVMNWILDFSKSMLETSRGGLIAGVGLGILIFTVMSIFSSIESSFNDIWQINEGRQWSRKLVDYFAMMLIAPLFFIFSSAFTVFLSTKIPEIAAEIRLLGWISPLLIFSVKLIPYLLIWMLFTLLYIVMPNTKVKFRSALIAGIIAGTLFQLAQWGYIHFQIGVTRYNAIYGSFAALPLLLLWMQISWLIVLFGAEISFANQNVEHYQYENESLNMSLYNRRLLAFLIIHLLVKNFQKGERPYTVHDISHELEIPIRLVSEIIYELTDIKVVSRVATSSPKEFAYQPAIDINKLTVRYLQEKLDHRGMDVMLAKNTKELKEISRIVETFQKEIEKSPENKLIAEI
jgi:membrane protein